MWFRFSINEATGDVTIAQPLDFEVRSIYQLDVTATDSGGLSVVVRYVITVQDFNDQAPVFSADQYSAFVDEGTNVLNPSITVQVGSFPSMLFRRLTPILSLL